MERKFKGVIWTDHALERLREREIKQGDAWATLRRPDRTRPAQKKGNWVRYKTFGDKRLEVVTAKNEQGETVVLSVWEREMKDKKCPPSRKAPARRGWFWKRLKKLLWR